MADGDQGHRVPTDADDLRSRAATLVDRLVALDAVLLARDIEVSALKVDAEQARTNRAAPVGTWFDVPRDHYDWPLFQRPDRDRATLDQYERRVDDDVFAAAAAGRAFLEQWNLEGARPNFAKAVAALTARQPLLNLVTDPDGPAPDVSIIIPVYGQLGYTLNCLDALLDHRSASRVEIIVIDDVSPDQTGRYLPRIPQIRSHRPAQNGGFIASCATGAAMARGRILVMLNNDTRVMPGWLDNLVDSFRLFPKAGLVGSKLLYPDGMLQEAGGIIWRDASGWNYGHRDDPNRPQYCSARRVDYVSGASIAVPADLWAELGGFDRLYAPAYYEDADLAFRMAEAGREVWFQPQSRLIHYEGKTSGTDTATGVKAYQLVNNRKFYLRWRERLLGHRVNGEAPYYEADRHVQQRVLVIEPTCPTPKQDAGSVYTVMILRLFQRLGYKTTFLPQDNFLFQPGNTTDLQREGIECAYAPYDLGFEAYIRRYGKLFDVIMVLRVQVLQAVIDHLAKHAPQAPVLFNVHDLHFLRMQREAELTGDADAMAAAAAMKRREIQYMQRVDCILTPSSYEVGVIREVLPQTPALALPLMADVVGTRVGFAARRDICFLGGYGHAPNVDAVRFFVEAIFPLIKAREPDMRFIIAGANPTEEVRGLAREDIVVTGMIDDLRELMDSTRLFVCPLRYGAGAKGKLVTAMSYGLPTVSTAIGTEGMPLQDEVHVLLADTPDDIAAACLRLYHDEALWDRLSAAGLQLVQDFYSPEYGKRVLREAVETAFRHKLKLDQPNPDQAMGSPSFSSASR